MKWRFDDERGWLRQGGYSKAIDALNFNYEQPFLWVFTNKGKLAGMLAVEKIHESCSSGTTLWALAWGSREYGTYPRTEREWAAANRRFTKLCLEALARQKLNQ